MSQQPSVRQGFANKNVSNVLRNNLLNNAACTILVKGGVEEVWLLSLIWNEYDGTEYEKIDVRKLVK